MGTSCSRYQLLYSFRITEWIMSEESFDVRDNGFFEISDIFLIADE